VIPVAAGDTPRLLEGSFQFTDNIAHAFSQDTSRFRFDLLTYVQDRIRDRAAHDRQLLREYLTHDDS
jgi:hypothetical protein